MWAFVADVNNVGNVTQGEKAKKDGELVSRGFGMPAILAHAGHQFDAGSRVRGAFRALESWSLETRALTPADPNC
jgi:hypothetical protein